VGRGFDDLRHLQSLSCFDRPWPTASAPRTLALVLVLMTCATSAARAAALGATTDFSTPTAFSAPQGIAAGPDGDLWFAEFTADKIAQLDPASGAIHEFTLPTPNAGPLGIAVGPDGNVWFTEYAASKIGEINPVTHAINEFPTPSANSGPVGIVAGPDGNLWFTESASAVNRIGWFNPVTHADGDIPAPTSAGGGVGPFGITLGPYGDLWYTEKGASRIGVVRPSNKTTFDMPTPTAASQPNEIEPGPDDSLWFTESAPAVSKVGVVDAVSGQIEEIPLGASAAPLIPVTGPDGDIWVTESGTSRIARINPVTHYVETVFDTATAGSGVSGIALGPDGNLWYTEPSVGKVGYLGTGVQAAPVTSPTVSGTAQPGSPLTCGGATWSTWAGLQPSASLFGFDGYQWLDNGSAIPGAAAQTYTPPSSEGGHKLSCRVTVTYGLTWTTASTTSPPVTLAYTRITAPITVAWAWVGKPCRRCYTIVKRLSVAALPVGATVQLSCAGRGCPLRKRTFKVAGRTLTMTKAFKHARLAAGSKIVLEITATNSLGEVVTYTTRAGSAPRSSNQCLPPGARRPTLCPST
jgi:streptogramin lyase